MTSLRQPPPGRTREARTIATMQQEILRLQRTVAALVGWMAGTAGSPINGVEAAQLLRMLEGTDGEEGE